MAPSETSDRIEIPDGWLAETGMTGFAATVASYRAGPNEHPSLPAPTDIALKDIRPPRRNPGVPRLVEERAISILKALASDAPLPPVLLYAVADGPFAYRLGAGFHRFHICKALGFRSIPAAVLEHWEPWMTGDPMP